MKGRIFEANTGVVERSVSINIALADTGAVFQQNAERFRAKYDALSGRVKRSVTSLVLHPHRSSSIQQEAHEIRMNPHGKVQVTAH